MARRPSKQGLSTGILIVLLAGVFVSQALQAVATHTPADKVVAAGDNITPVNDDGTILTAFLKTSKPTDLMLHVTLECSINTELTTSDSGELSEASANIDVWVEIDDKVVPIKSVSSPPQSPPSLLPPGAEETEAATFCNRTYGRTVTDQDGDGTIDREDDYIRTKSTHAFNWLALNVGSDPAPHKVEVVADFDRATVGDARVFAQIGNRTLIVEPAKLANDATI